MLTFTLPSMPHGKARLCIDTRADLSERRCVICAVPNHGYAPTLRLQLLNQSGLAGRLDASVHVLRLDPHCGCDSAGCALLITCLASQHVIYVRFVLQRPNTQHQMEDQSESQLECVRHPSSWVNCKGGHTREQHRRDAHSPQAGNGRCSAMSQVVCDVYICCEAAVDADKHACESAELLMLELLRCLLRVVLSRFAV